MVGQVGFKVVCPKSGSTTKCKGKDKSQKADKKKTQVGKRKLHDHMVVEPDREMDKPYKRGAFRRYRKFNGMRLSGKKHREIGEKLKRQDEERRQEEPDWTLEEESTPFPEPPDQEYFFAPGFPIGA